MTTAEKIAKRLGNLGTNYTCDATGEALDEMADHYGCEIVRKNDATSYEFSDGSVITCTGEAWDIGFLHCLCWAGCPDDDCDNPEHAVKAARMISVDNGRTHRFADAFIDFNADCGRDWFGSDWWPVILDAMDFDTCREAALDAGATADRDADPRVHLTAYLARADNDITIG